MAINIRDSCRYRALLVAGWLRSRKRYSRRLAVAVADKIVNLFIRSCECSKLLSSTGVKRIKLPVSVARLGAIRRREAFGGTTTQCQAYNGYGNCLRAFVTVPYQCTGADAVPAPPTPTVGSTYAPSAIAGTPITPQILQPSASTYAPQPAISTYDTPQPPEIVTQQGNSASASSPTQSVPRNKLPPIVVFTHASDATRADQSADFDDMINAVANGAKPPSGGN